jgi:hypothetical protein
MTPKQVVCLPYWYLHQEHQAVTFHPNARHTWKVHSSSLSALQPRGDDVWRWTVLLESTVDDVEHSVSYTTNAYHIRCPNAGIGLVQHCWNFLDTMALSLQHLDCLMLSWARIVTYSSMLSSSSSAEDDELESSSPAAVSFATDWFAVEAARRVSNRLQCSADRFSV